MATITGFTADRMLVIENETVVDGDVVGNNLHLIRRDGVVIDAGNVRGATGATGVQGPPGTNGTNGTNGKDGLGVPAGGLAAQILTKNTNVDNDTIWKTPALPFAPVHFRATHGTQSIPRSVWTNVTAYGAPNENTGGGTWSGGVYTVPADGSYLMIGAILWAVPTLTGWMTLQCQIVVSEAGMFPTIQDIRGLRDTSAFNGATGPVSGVRPLPAGSTIRLQAYNGHPSAAVNLFGGYLGLEINRVE